jgi:murein L,D-transpeptidase YcbB/YkuD
MRVTVRKLEVACMLGLLLMAGGCRRFRRTRSAPKSDAFADKLKPIVASHKVQVLHVPDFSDYSQPVQQFYNDRNYEVAWVEDDGSPSPQANALMNAFEHADQKGLNPADFDAGRWQARVDKLHGKKDDDVAEYDAAMTVSVMRYISQLHVGRVNPTHFNFDIDTQNKKYDLPEFVSDNVVDADDVPKLIASVEPDNDQYRKTEAALGTYLQLQQKQAADADLQQPLPTVTSAISAGASYPAADALAARLQLEGDMKSTDGTPGLVATVSDNSKEGAGQNSGLTDTDEGAHDGTEPVPAATRTSRLRAAITAQLHHGRSLAHPEKKPSARASTLKPSSTVYTAELAAGVKHYQQRHGMTDDGRLSPAVIASLNVPMSARVSQLDDSLERWRWLPNEYGNAPLMVNLPEFVLRGYDSGQPGHTLDFTMKVVVGKVLGDHDTPVFTHEMKYVIFRPFWNVPMSIIKKELTAHIEKSGVGYLAAHNFETVNAKGEHVDASAAEVERGGVVVREKPGAKNSLGLVKFMFPNEYDIYLHSTPVPELFNRSRRDFSHGCVRVQHPDELAVWVLRNTPGDWTLDKVHDAFNTGPDNHTVVLKQPIPIVIFYATANVDADGQVHFFDDLYGYDKQLNDVLARGMPYPAEQQKINPNAVATPGDTT